MPEVVPSSLTTPANKQAQGDAASGPPKVPGARSDSQARIDELAAQKAHFQKKFQDGERELLRMREEIANLRGRVEAAVPQQPAAPPKTWADMNDAQLDEAKRWARQNDNADTLDSIYGEVARREAKRAADIAVEQSKKHYEQDQYVREVQAGILRDFGPDAFDEEQPLYQEADKIMSNLIAREGKDRVRSSPSFLRAAFLEAERKVRTSSERERLKTLEGEYASLKDRATLLERGGTPSMAPPPNDAVKEALSRGDRKGAIKALLMTRNLKQQATGDALSQRR